MHQKVEEPAKAKKMDTPKVKETKEEAMKMYIGLDKAKIEAG